MTRKAIPSDRIVKRFRADRSQLTLAYDPAQGTLLVVLDSPNAHESIPLDQDQTREFGEWLREQESTGEA